MSAKAAAVTGCGNSSTFAQQLSVGLVSGVVLDGLASAAHELFPKALHIRLSLLSGQLLVCSSNLAQSGFCKLALQPVGATVAGHAISRGQWLHVGQAVQSRGCGLYDLEEACTSCGCESVLSIPIFGLADCSAPAAVGALSLAFKHAADLTFGLLAEAQSVADALGQHLVRDTAALLDSISLLFMQGQPAFTTCRCGCGQAAEEGADDKEDMPTGFCKDWPDGSGDPGAGGGAAPVISWLQSLPTEDDTQQASVSAPSQHSSVEPQPLPASMAAAGRPPLGHLSSQQPVSMLRQRRLQSSVPASSRSSSLGSKMSLASSAALAPCQHGLWLTYADAQLEQEFSEFHAAQQSKVDMMACTSSMLIYLCAAYIKPLHLMESAPRLYPVIFVPFLLILATMALRMQWYLKHREPFMLLTFLVVYCHLAFVAGPVIMSAHAGDPKRLHSVVWLARLIGTEALLTSPIGLQMRLTRFVPSQLTAFAITLRLVSPACSLCFPSLPQSVCVMRALLCHFVVGVGVPLIGVHWAERRNRSMFLVTKQRNVASRAALASSSSLDALSTAPVGT